MTQETKHTTHTKYTALLLIFGALLLFASFLPNLYEVSLTDKMAPDRVMTWGEQFYLYDYNVYLSKIRQGMEGRWTVVDKYDNNPDQKGVFLQMIYLLGGKVGGALNLTPPTTFHLMRFLLSFSFIVVLIVVAKAFFKKPRLYSLAVILSLLAGSWPTFFERDGTVWVGYFMSWWHEMETLRRVSYVPHYTLNYIIVLVLTYLLYRFSSTRKRKYYAWIAILIFLSFFIHPAGGIVFLLSWVLYHMLTSVVSWDEKRIKLGSAMIQTFVLFAIAAIPLLYIRSVTSVYPWKSLIEFDTTLPPPFNVRDYLLTLGPMLLTGVAGMYLVLMQRNITFLPFVTWFLGAFVGIAIFQFFPQQSALRMVQTANHVPLAFLTVYFLDEMTKRLKNRLVTLVSGAIIVALVILGLVHSYFSIKGQNDFIKQRVEARVPLVPYPPTVMYPLVDFWNGIQWLAQNTNAEDVVLSEMAAGNYIPAYAGNHVYVGHNPETPHFWDRELRAFAFFEGTMSVQNAQKFLNEESIAYVFYGPQEKDKAIESIDKYGFLTPVFTSTHVTVYKVEDYPPPLLPH